MNARLQIIQFWKVNLNSYKEKQRKKGKLSTMLLMKNKSYRIIHNNQIVIVTGRAGSGKSLVCARAALNFLMKKRM
jgi:type II secretory pathway predicted ATPase ExeA